MAIKTHAELTSDLADNSVGAITPGDIRNLLDSVFGVYGSLLISGNSTGQAVVADTAEQLTEWTNNGISSGTTPAFASNQITIDNAGDYEVSFFVSFEGLTASEFKYSLRKNGSELSPVLSCERKTANNDVGDAAFSGQITLAATDVLSVWIESTVTGSPVVRDAQLVVKRIG